MGAIVSASSSSISTSSPPSSVSRRPEGKAGRQGLRVSFAGDDAQAMRDGGKEEVALVPLAAEDGPRGGGLYRSKSSRLGRRKLSVVLEE